LHGARLRSFLAIGLVEPDFGPNRQPLEPVVQHAVAMKVHVAIVRGLEEAISGLCEEPRHERPRLVRSLDLASPLLGHGLHLPARCLERAYDDAAEVVMHVAVERLSAHHDGPTRPHGDEKPYAVGVAAALEALRTLDGHTAADDPTSVTRELLRLTVHHRLDRLGPGEVPE